MERIFRPIFVVFMMTDTRLLYRFFFIILNPTTILIIYRSLGIMPEFIIGEASAMNPEYLYESRSATPSG